MELKKNARILMDQLDVSMREIDRLKDIPTVEAGKEFDYHVSIVNQLRYRAEVYKASMENLEALNKELERV
ncbi:hypothetical protein BEP19_15685 [Ammoniphilus oxalaticus]|uniref:Uncharacterized protein n=1 Tax=Ammoniphilus oxalaticus TaxID=66863 RepID=A0A419SDF5_9BACL|nr:hypothetical protein [Ammoniphilus oxalaticus]RKD21114.1 hypothetical protein BEP19_15685 [Ammoniphilus oxalaticus]